MDSFYYESPLATRYASEEMSRLFSSHKRVVIWRKLWIALARAEMELGLPITEEQIQEMEDHIEKIDFSAAAEKERSMRHDVMAHIHTFGDQCPKAKGIIHLGATSCYVTDNGDLIQMREGLQLLLKKLVQTARQLAVFSEEHSRLPCLAFTHFQPAQPTSVGKRACMWLQDLLIDIDEVENRMQKMRFLGVKGTTGTQASFLALFNGKEESVKALDLRVGELMGFSRTFTISGQTYTRKQDILILDTLSGIAVTAHKIANDIRLLAHMKEVEEPFEENQTGSSAMPYKRNPMRSERVCSLARFLIALGDNPKYTAATQWLERTLDDSANRRLAISEAFLCCDAILDLLINITSGLVVYKKSIQKNLDRELPFMATENILMELSKLGFDRQKTHEKLKEHSRAAAFCVKERGQENDLMERLSKDPYFALDKTALCSFIKAESSIGLSHEQVHTFLAQEVYPALERYAELPDCPSLIQV